MDSENPKSAGVKNPDGSFTLTTSFGATVSGVPGEPVSVTVGEIRKVGIENIMHVKQHYVNDVLGSKSHVITFNDGGTVKFAYGADGDLFEFSCEGATLFVNSQNEIVVSMSDDSE